MVPGDGVFAPVRRIFTSFLARSKFSWYSFLAMKNEMPATATGAPATKFAIMTPSAYTGRLCLIGEGATPGKAWADAYGPKPWSDYAKRCAKKAWVTEVTLDELHDLHVAAAE